jgi:transcription-repair coupling factor (superfamily II helicase)
VAGVPSGSVGLIAWWLRETTNRTILVVSPESERVYADSLVWSGGSGSAIFPAGDTPPFDRVPPSEEVTRARLATLMRLHSREPLLVVASPRGLLRPTLSRSVVEAGLTEVKRGARLPRDQLVGRLVELGYRRESAVSVPGDFAVRGGIVDVFGVDRARPWRAEWFGDDVEDLRVFDPATQESIAKLEAAQVWPARELDLTSESVARALELVEKLDAAALREDVREQWESDCDLLQAGVYEEGLDLFFPYLGGEPQSTLLDHLDDPIVLLDGGRGASCDRDRESPYPGGGARRAAARRGHGAHRHRGAPESARRVGGIRAGA